MKVNETAIPRELREIDQWVDWKYGHQNENGKRPKIPVNPETERNASTTDPETWGTFKEAIKQYRRSNLDGIGFVFTDTDLFVGIDIDNCLDRIKGMPNELAQTIIDGVATYTEISPSGRGIKMIAKCKLPIRNLKTEDIEIYVMKKYFTITGNHLPGTPRVINDRSEVIAKIHKFFAPSPKEQAPQKQQEPIPYSLTDDEVIARVMNSPGGEKFKQLWEGDISGYPSQSEADLALVGVLVPLTGGNLEQIDGLFRKSKLMREKWDKKHSADGKTYGEMTIQKAIEGRQQVYLLPSPSPCSTEDIIKALEDNEQGDADLYIKIHRDRLCFDHAAKRWYVWLEHYWIEDITNVALASIMNVVAVYQEEYDRLNQQQLEARKNKTGYKMDQNTDLMKELDKRISQLKTLHRREHILVLASAGENSLGITGYEWDMKPWTIACANGVLCLKGEDVTFGPGCPTDYIKTVAPTKWEGKDTLAPLWKQTLKQIFQKDLKLIWYVQKLLGYALTGSCSEHVFPILNGPGRNGKSTIIETLNHVLGPLATPIPTETLLSQTSISSGGAPRADLIKLRGARLAWASESQVERRFNEGQIKQLTGGDTIAARSPYGRHMVKFPPTHTLLFITNHVPHISSDDYAFWQRIHIIPFLVSFVTSPMENFERKADTLLREKLKAEAPGILAWLVRGCLGWQKKGLKRPAAVREAVQLYRRGEDVLGRFLEDRCKKREGKEVNASRLFEAYRNWCRENDIPPWSQTIFGKKMGKRFGKKSSNGTYYLGLYLRKM